MRVFGLACVALLAGCAAERVESRGPRKGPVPEVGYVDPGGGEVRYALEGWGAVVSARRRDAMRIAGKACKGMGFKITDEFERQDADVPYSRSEDVTQIAEGVDHFKVEPFQHLVFECLVPPPRPAVPAPLPSAP